ncbi:MAG: tetratricopeptide repeat protein [Cyanobacteria bacterium J06627_32]
MAFKKDSWLVRGVLVLAVAAFVAVPVLFAFNGRSSSGDANLAATQQPSADQASKLQGEIDGYTAVLGREPNNQTALIGIIEAKIALGDLEGTVEPLEKLAELNPTVPEYAIALAQTKQQLQDLEGAAQVYRRVLTQNPGSIPALEGLVALLISQKRTEAAVGLLRDTLATADQTNELSPGSIDKLSVKLLLGQVYVEQKSYDEALKLYDETIADAQAASPTQPDFRPTLAKALVLREQGDEAGAKALFDQALALAPTQYKDGVRELISEGTAAASEESAETGTEDAAAVEPAEDAETAGSEATSETTEPPVAP